MKRGNLVTIAIQGDFGKPRPALVVQTDHFSDHPSTTVLPMASRIVDAPLLRITLEPTDSNGLKQTSQIMIDKVVTVRGDKIGPVFGHIDATSLQKVERALAIFLGIAK